MLHVFGAALAATLAVQSPPCPAQGAQEIARVYYDADAIPHVFGDTDADVFYGLGRQQVRDFPMLTLGNLWSATGDSATIFGAAPAATPPIVASLQDDALAHQRQWPALAAAQEASLTLAGDATLPLLQAYVDGVNAERQRWLQDKSSLLAKHTYGDLAELLEAAQVLDRLLGTPVELRHVLSFGAKIARGLSAGDIPSASNAWLISRSASCSGNPITLGDPHLPVQDGGMHAYFIQLHAREGNYRVAGVSLPGWPCIAFGFNENLSWTITAAPIPYPLTKWSAQATATNRSILIDAGTPGQRTQSIEVRPLSLQYFPIDLGNPSAPLETYLGATATFVMADSADPIYPFGYEVTNEITSTTPHTFEFEQAGTIATGCVFSTLIKLGMCAHAGSGPDATYVDTVLASGDLMIGNFLFADRAGALEYVRGGVVPRQGAAAAALMTGTPVVLNGNLSSHRWQGFHPFADMPREFSPASAEQQAQPGTDCAAPSGYAAREVWINCNVSPQFVRPQPTIDLALYAANNWLYLGANGAVETWRQARATELLRHGGSVGTPPATFLDQTASEAAAFDQRDNWAVAIRPYALAALNQAWPGGTAPAGVNALANAINLQGGASGWNYVADVASEGEVWMSLLRGMYACALEASGASAAEASLALSPASAHNPTVSAFLGDPAWTKAREALVSALSSVGVDLLTATSPPLLNALFDPFLPSAGGHSSVTTWGECHWLVTYPAPTFKTIAGAACFPALNDIVPFVEITFAPDIGVVPVGGVADALFVTNHTTQYSTLTGGGGDYGRLLGCVPGFSTQQIPPMYTIPHTSGSQTLLCVELTPTGPIARYLSALGASEIADYDEDDHIAATEPRLAPTAKFANGTWTQLTTAEAALCGVHFPAYGAGPVIWQ